MVYFIDEELIKEKEREAKEIEIDDSLRGWSYNKEPVKPIFDAYLPVSVIASQHCPCGGIVYLTYVEKKKIQPIQEQIVGSIYHNAILRVISEAKRLLYIYPYIHGIDLVENLQKMFERFEDEEIKERISDGKVFELVKTNCAKLWSYEALQIAARVSKVMAESKELSKDSLLQKSIPILSEVSIDGRLIGLSSRLRLDALSFPPIVFDLKSGRKKDYDRLFTTGYALAFESFYRKEVNVGCIAYVRFKEDLPYPIIERDLHVIDEHLRYWFLQLRDEKARIVADKIDPRKRGNCLRDCPYREL